MTRTLRRRHRIATLALALALPPAVALALAARPPEPRNADLRAVLHEPAQARSGKRVVELDPRGEPLAPDALVYWSPGSVDGDALPADSVFLDTLPADAPRAFTAPGSGAGRLVVFSLAWQRIVRAVPVAAEPAP